MHYTNDSDDWKALGGVLYSNNPANIERFDLINSCFMGCGGVNTTNYYRSAFISNIRSNVDDCSFINCWHKNTGENIDPDEMRTMFTPQSSATNCLYMESARFN